MGGGGERKERESNIIPLQLKTYLKKKQGIEEEFTQDSEDS